MSQKDPVARAAYWQKYYAANKERLLEKQRQDPKGTQAKCHRWRSRNPQYVLTMREWRKNHQTEGRTYKLQRRAAMSNGHHTSRQWLEKVVQFDGRCAYCGQCKPLVRDHDIPLSRGGSNNIDNIIPACRSCNAKKYTRTAQEFIAEMAA